MLYLWLKTFHLVAMVAWFAGLFYLPRLFVYHTQVATTDTEGLNRFQTMERRLYWGITTPSAIVTVILGFGLIHAAGYSMTNPPKWLLVKFALVGALLYFHARCGKYIRQLKANPNHCTTLYFRIFNEVPVFLLIGIIALAILKPMF